MPDLKYIAGEDIKAGLHVIIAGDGQIIVCPADRSSESLFVLDRDVKKGETITYQMLPNPPSILTGKEWAVVTDEGVTTDLTYQEAQQLEIALTAQGVRGYSLSDQCRWQTRLRARIRPHEG